MRFKAKQTNCAGERLWIVKDTGHPWKYSGPFESCEAAVSAARELNKEHLPSITSTLETAEAEGPADIVIDLGRGTEKSAKDWIANV